MTVFGHGVDGAAGVGATGGVVGMRAFAATPAVIAPRHHAIHFFPGILSDIAHPELAIVRVEAPAPGIAEAVGVYLRTILREYASVVVACRTAGKGICGRDGIVRGA